MFRRQHEGIILQTSADGGEPVNNCTQARVPGEECKPLIKHSFLVGFIPLQSPRSQSAPAPHTDNNPPLPPIPRQSASMTMRVSCRWMLGESGYGRIAGCRNRPIRGGSHRVDSRDLSGWLGMRKQVRAAAEPTVFSVKLTRAEGSGRLL